MRFDNAVANELAKASSNDAERAIQRATKAEYDLKCLQESTVDKKAYERLRADLDEAVRLLQPFVKAASHTRTFLVTREKMNPVGVSLFDEEVEAARAFLALQEKEAA